MQNSELRLMNYGVRKNMDEELLMLSTSCKANIEF